MIPLLPQPPQGEQLGGCSQSHDESESMDTSDLSRKCVRETAEEKSSETLPVQLTALFHAIANNESTNNTHNEHTGILMQGQHAVWNPEEYDDISIALSVKEEDLNADKEDWYVVNNSTATNKKQ